MEHRPTPLLERVSSTRAGDWWLRGAAALSWLGLLVYLLLLPGSLAREKVYQQDRSCQATLADRPVAGACTLLRGRMTGSERVQGRNMGYLLRYRLDDGETGAVAQPLNFVDAASRAGGVIGVRMYKGKAVRFTAGTTISDLGHDPVFETQTLERPLTASAVGALLFGIPVPYLWRKPRV